jgi:DNA-binding NarL/FixJ family response regulator
METVNKTSSIRVAIVDDHKVVTEGLEHLITESGVARVVGKSYSAAGCMQMLETVEVDVLLLDVSLPDGNGMDLCPKIKLHYPCTKILMITSYSEMTIIKRTLKSGASGYILKSAVSDEVIAGISAVVAGKEFLSDEVTRLINNRKADTVILSRREQELLSMIVAGLSNSEIADKMFLGYETVKSYRKNLMLKLDAHNTATLVKIALEKNLI